MQDILLTPFIDELSACIHEKNVEQGLAFRLQNEIVASKNLTPAEKIRELQRVSRYSNSKAKILNGRIEVAIKSNR